MPDYNFIAEPDSIATALVGHPQIGVDTEFMREKTYFAQLCLVQISTPDAIYCVDPLTDEPRQAFWDKLLNSPWVVHSARQDIEVVSQTADAMPREIFDTQIAAGLLGLSPQMGYAGLVKELFDVDMAKSHTRADWTRRPLSESVLQYAAEDVEYLLPAAATLAERLEKKGRLDWAKQDSALLLDKKLYDIGSDQAVDRLKGARNFRGRKRAAAVMLAKWREEQAIQRNRPRQWIIRDNVLLDVAYQLPTSESQLSKIDGMPPKTLRRVGRDLLQIVADSAQAESQYQPPRPPDEAQKAQLKAMQSLVQKVATEMSLAAETVASKRELSAILASGDQESRVFQGWRQDLVGNALQNLL